MAVIVSDSFNRTGTTLGSTDSYNGGTSKAWYTGDGISVATNGSQAYTTSSGDSYAVVDAVISDVKVSITHSTYQSWSKIIWRYTNSSNFFWIESGGVYKKVSGSTTSLASFSAPASGDTLSVTCNGTTHTVYKNGVQVATFTDAFNQTVTKHGFGISSTAARIDNFNIEDLNAGGTGTNVTVTGVVASATSDSLAPIVTAQQQASITSVITDSTADAIIPSITTVSSVSVSINSIVADATIDTFNPTISTESNILSSFATITADTLNPVISSSVNVNVTSVIASAANDTINPVISTDTNIISVIGAVTTDSLIPSVGSMTNITVNSVMADITADTISPIVNAVSNVNLQTISAEINIDTMAPFVGSSSITQITAVIAMAQSDVTVPVIATEQSNRIAPVIADLFADANSPILEVQRDVIVPAFIADLQVVAMPAGFNVKVIISKVNLKGNRDLNVYLKGDRTLNVNLKGLIQ